MSGRLSSTTPLLPAAVLWLVAAPTVAEPAEVLYCKTFPIPTGTGALLRSVGWSYCLGPQRWDETSNAATQGLVNEHAGTQHAADIGVIRSIDGGLTRENLNLNEPLTPGHRDGGREPTCVRLDSHRGDFVVTTGCHGV